MKLCIYDQMIANLTIEADEYIEANGKYAPCKGCFHCWTKNPATCDYQDCLQEVSRKKGMADTLIIITKNCYGGYSSNVKMLLDRSIGSSTPLSTYRGKQMHHTLRYGYHDRLIVYVYGDINEQEKETWKLMVERNAINEAYHHYEVIFLEGE